MMTPSSIAARFYLANVSSLTDQVINSLLYAMVEACFRLSMPTRVAWFDKLVLRRNPDQAIAAARQTLTNGFLVQRDYIDQYSDAVGVFVAFPASALLRLRYGLDVRAGMTMAAFATQFFVEMGVATACTLWASGFLGYRHKVATWRFHQSNHSYIRHSAVALLVTPLCTMNWILSAVSE